MKIRVCCIILLLFFALPAFGQYEEDLETEGATRNRIEGAMNSFIQSHKYKIGIFRLQPKLSFHAGFDSNAAFGNFNDNEEDADFFFTVVPGLSGGVKLGSRAFVRAIEDVYFIYYLKREDRRDIFNTTLAEFVTGTPGILLRLNGGYLRRQDAVNEELDEPVDHTTTHMGAGVDYSATSRIEMHHNIRVQTNTFETTEDVSNSGLTLNERRTITFGTGTRYQLKRTLYLTGNFGISRSESLKSEDISNSWHLLGGVELQQPRVNARFALGFGESDSGNDSNRQNVLLDGSATALVGRKLTVGGFANRRYEFSFLDADATRVTTQGGARFSSPLATRLTLGGQYTVGKNDYGDSLINGQIVQKDNFQRGNVGIAIRTFKWVSVRPGIAYIKRDTDITDLNKEKFGFVVTVGLGYSIGF